ncbi:leucine-rich repeat-containing protein 24 isoform X2 [Drosophila virilis]|uniref:leucine-rich repeat-containing protein 24 isoform X2 n=1 Tax=Drosophila virilis TaxID=7244 RepID=UPI0038B2BB7C
MAAAMLKRTMLRLLLTSLVLLAMLAQESLGHRDWMQNCSNCHCHWNSGKKSADCKGKKLTKIPLEMSNEMQVVDFSQNQIPELRRDEFQVAGLQNLHKIYLRNCTIQEVNRDAFKGLAILIELDMSSNRISQLHPNTFEGLEKLRNVIINNNEIEILESRLFINLPFLSRVEFNNNRLKQVQLNVFGGPLTAISLEQNQLTHLHKETFDNLPKLTYLSLQGNAWNCSCELQQFRDFAMAKRLYTPPTDCREPAQLRGKLWSEVPSENFACRPRILGSVRSFVEANHDNITLPCRIVGTPRPNVTWIYNKRQLNPGPNDHHIRILNSVEQQQPAASAAASGQVMTSELRIYGVRNSDKGAYICVADNRGGKAEAEFQLLVNGDYMGASAASDGLGGLGISGAIGASTSDPQTSIFLVICVIVTTFLVLLIFLVLTLFWYCRRVKTYQKDNTMMSGDGLISCKLDKTHNSSMLEGSVIMEMQKSLLNEVNPVEKPPRRTDIESVDGGDDGHEIKKTLLDETAYELNHI